MATLDLSQAKFVFDDEFNSFNMRSSSNPNGVWQTSYAFGGHTLSSNGEQEYYVDPSNQPNLPNPFSANNGVLTITANPTPGNLMSQTQGLPYTSGVMITDGNFAQTYGIFEMHAQLPAGQGLWPAFWLLPTDHSWPPEIDVMEMLGNQVNTDYTTVHSNSLSGGSSGQGNTVADTTTGYHTYAVDWEPDYVTFYFDGQQVFKTATPSDMHKPMYMLANLAVGGNWPGHADGSTPFPAGMNIDWIRAYATSNTIADVNNSPAPYSTVDSTPGADAGSSTSGTSGIAGGSSGGATSTITTIDAGAIQSHADGAALARLYQAALGRQPDAAGLHAWIDAFEAAVPTGDQAAVANATSWTQYVQALASDPVNGQSIASAFTHSAEFQNAYGSLTDNTAFVTQLYENSLHRAPDAAGLAAWVDAANHGMSHEAILIGFAESAENMANTAGWIVMHS
jgi:beta-glucanase (GH16 family)